MHGFLQKVWSKPDEINDFEKLITTQNNTTILKFFLHISKEEQLARFEKRLDDPAREWKISESDYKEHEYWDHYTKAFEDVLNKTSTEHAPWFIIPSNHKWFRDLAISQIIVRDMEDVDMEFPKPTVNLAEIRRKYHQASAEERSDGRDTLTLSKSPYPQRLTLLLDESSAEQGSAMALGLSTRRGWMVTSFFAFLAWRSIIIADFHIQPDVVGLVGASLVSLSWSRSWQAEWRTILAAGS